MGAADLVQVVDAPTLLVGDDQVQKRDYPVCIIKEEGISHSSAVNQGRSQCESLSDFSPKGISLQIVCITRE